MPHDLPLYPEPEQASLTLAIRADAIQHQTTAVYLWRTALEQVNPEVLPVPPYCAPAALVDVYDLLDMASNKTTSPQLARLASRVLRDPRSSATAKKLAATALAQAQPRKRV